MKQLIFFIFFLAIVTSVCLCSNSQSLIEAVNRGDFRSVKQLLTIEDPNQTDSSGATPLHIAAQFGYQDIAEQLIAKGANVLAKNHQRKTPLHIAARYNQTKIIRLLLANNSNVDAEDFDGILDSTPLHEASEMGHLNSAEILVYRGADLQAVNSDKLTPVDLAVVNDHVELVQFFLKNLTIQPSPTTLESHCCIKLAQIRW